MVIVEVVSLSNCISDILQCYCPKVGRMMQRRALSTSDMSICAHDHICQDHIHWQLGVIVILSTFYIYGSISIAEELEVLVSNVLNARLCIIPPTATLGIIDNVVDRIGLMSKLLLFYMYIEFA